MKSRRYLRGPWSLVMMVVVAALIPLSAQSTALSADPPPDDGLFYLFGGDLLGNTAEGIAVRFEYRGGERLLRHHDLTVSFGGGESLLLPIPPLVWPTAAGAVDIELLVFVDGLLVARFDGESLLQYNRTLRQTHPDLVAALSPAHPGDAAKSALHRISAKIECNSPCGGGCQPSQDYDCDGVANSIDNCIDHQNPGQQDCDGDSWGDACDAIDGIFQESGPVTTCLTDRDDKVTYRVWEHHVEQRLVDVTACGSPDRWDRWIRFSTNCSFDDTYCCKKLSTSILQVGDDPDLWCGERIDQSFCH